MGRRPTRTRTTLAGFLLALTLIAPRTFGQDPEAITEIRGQAEQGDVTAQFNLGAMYDLGAFVPQDDAEAARWYRLAAEEGHAISQVHLGFMHSEGRGVPQDDAEAMRWYRLAADQGGRHRAAQPWVHAQRGPGRAAGRRRSHALVSSRRRPG